MAVEERLAAPEKSVFHRLRFSSPKGRALKAYKNGFFAKKERAQNALSVNLIFCILQELP
jgi:hypothetical protein